MSIEIINLTKTYKKSPNEGIFDLSFSLEKKDVIAFVGNNGAGKTTTIKSIFNEMNINKGEILLDKENIFSYKNLNRVAFFPDSNNIPLNLTTRQLIFHIGYLSGLNKEKIKEKTSLILKLLDIEELKDKKIKKLSAGQKKKIIMASVLIKNPEYILFDEPTANLDLESKIDFIRLIKKMSELNIGILITSHMIEDLQQVANKLIIIEKGHLVFNKKIDKQKENILDIYKAHITSKKRENISFEGILGV